MYPRFKPTPESSFTTSPFTERVIVSPTARISKWFHSPVGLDAILFHLLLRLNGENRPSVKVAPNR